MIHPRTVKKVSRKRHPSLDILDKSHFLIMGIVNVTPDSFYDGGKYNTLRKACDHAEKLAGEGADILDIGGESSRPGSLQVSFEEEVQRVVPVIEGLKKKIDIPISIDTTKSAVAKRALDSGAEWINDISAGRFDNSMASLAAERQCPVVLMHSRKKPHNMQKNPGYENVVREVLNELYESVNIFLSKGVCKENIILDPGIGFAKRFEDNIELIRNLNTISQEGFPVLIGTSRKSFIGRIIGEYTNDRLYGTLGSIAMAYLNGAKIFRVHDVRETRDFLKVLSAIERS